ncbi:MAG TPA: hypothetical protein DEG17_13725 [Cyanobacteria bacterium UBA11149]|nr:hypothetical protein [Cyanobacteria bacterium UBA11366]HBK61975.1 hypothetical protein [Cyanobacteria bacterium UBA11166]HBR73197.1 hypothetical protein [Cyanobacteria bacterium UBA11159]HBS68918.1 hypothetical protein [Cyanobacteria bacterium UBA11153]HBW89899.1 hypothetical protein [Cyanobacteria bacterium UBA11149]HCA96316.1 hypothetical protein [Cyanobacteria bacterium UBA9226]
MLEVTIFSLLVGNFGWQAVVVSAWLRWRQIVRSRLDCEEEETLTCFESKEESTLAKSPPWNGNINGASYPDSPSRDPHLVGWEFKIVRANRDLFHNPAIFKKLCEEEAQAGWILLEKLDDRRVRFKRLIAFRDVIDTQRIQIDPYRTYYGSSWRPFNWLGAIALFVAIAVPSYFSYSLASKMIARSQESSPANPYQDIPNQNFPPAN